MIWRRANEGFMELSTQGLIHHRPFFFPPEKFMARVKEVTEKACEVFFVALLAF